jgi:hypothetical protein
VDAVAVAAATRGLGRGIAGRDVCRSNMVALKRVALELRG